MSGTDKVRRRREVSCTECDDFEFAQTFTGTPGTRGEQEYERSGDFDECPVCGGAVETSDVGD